MGADGVVGEGVIVRNPGATDSEIIEGTVCLNVVSYNSIVSRDVFNFYAHVLRSSKCAYIVECDVIIVRSSDYPYAKVEICTSLCANNVIRDKVII